MFYQRSPPPQKKTCTCHFQLLNDFFFWRNSSKFPLSSCLHVHNITFPVVLDSSNAAYATGVHSGEMAGSWKGSGETRPWVFSFISKSTGSNGTWAGKRMQLGPYVSFIEKSFIHIFARKWSGTLIFFFIIRTHILGSYTDFTSLPSDCTRQDVFIPIFISLMLLVSLFAGHPKRDSFNKVVWARQPAQPSPGQPPTETASTVTIGEHKNKKARTRLPGEASAGTGK